MNTYKIIVCDSNAPNRNYAGENIIPANCARYESDYVVIKYNNVEVWLREMGDGRLVDENDNYWNTVELAEFDEEDEYQYGHIIGYIAYDMNVFKPTTSGNMT